MDLVRHLTILRLAGTIGIPCFKADAVAAWRERTGSVTREFAAAHPEVMQRLRAVAGAEYSSRY